MPQFGSIDIINYVEINFEIISRLLNQQTYYCITMEHTILGITNDAKHVVCLRGQKKHTHTQYIDALIPISSYHRPKARPY